MNVSTLSRLASAGVVTGVATIAFAAPASAMQPDPPNYGYDQNTGQTVDDGGTNWGLIGGGAAAGVAVLGAGAAAAIGVRRHHHHAPHPVA
jgi:hypothetical protein